MNVEMMATDLNVALKTLPRFPSTRAPGVQRSVVFRLHDSVVELLASNGRVACGVPVLGCRVTARTHAVPNPASFQVDASALRGWAKKQRAVVSLRFDGPSSSLVARGEGQPLILMAEGEPKFPYWDEALAGTVPHRRVATARLRAALEHVRGFVSRDGKKPRMEFAQARDGALWAVRHDALAIVATPDLRGSAMKVHRRELPHLIKFIGHGLDHETCEVHEDDRCLFVVRVDGAVMVLGKPSHTLPPLHVDPRVEAPHRWRVERDALINGLAIAMASNDNHGQVGLRQEASLLVLSTTRTRQAIALHEVEPGHGPVGLPAPEIWLVGELLRRAVAGHRGAMLELGFVPTPEPGWMYVRWQQGGDSYFTALAAQRPLS